MVVCPGCGGRNDPDVKTCEWCGRPFFAQPRRLGGPVVMLGAAAIVGVVVLVAAGLAITTLVSAFSNRPVAGPTAAPPTEAPLLRPPLDDEALAPSAETAPGQEFVRVANTAGAGAFIREEPRSAARGIVAHTDRTVLKVIGADVSADGRPWRNVEDQRGNRGWTPSEFLVASDVGF